MLAPNGNAAARRGSVSYLPKPTSKLRSWNMFASNGLTDDFLPISAGE
jgi:hypothetical protein